jgi:putative DNA topoisomerase
MPLAVMSKKSNQDSPLFKQHEHALEREFGVCPACGSELQLKQSKKGPFLGCASYPNCDYTRPLHETIKSEDQILVGSECPQCGAELAVKHGRYGVFIGCSNFPQCHFIQEDTEAEADQVTVQCPKCQQGSLIKRTSRFGKTFYGCDHYPQCQYIVNFEPVAQSCPQCRWPIMLKREYAQGMMLVCPQKKCAYKQKFV